MKRYFTLIFILALALFSAITFSQAASAADFSKFNAGNIMSDYVMSNRNSMTEEQIQQFLLHVLYFLHPLHYSQMIYILSRNILKLIYKLQRRLNYGNDKTDSFKFIFI